MLSGCRIKEEKCVQPSPVNHLSLEQLEKYSYQCNNYQVHLKDYPPFPLMSIIL